MIALGILSSQTLSQNRGLKAINLGMYEVT